MVSGDAIGALGMTEPSCGIDLKALRTTARRDGSDYVIHGQHTFITNAKHCDLLVLACHTHPDQGAKGIRLTLVADARPGCARGRNPAKHATIAPATRANRFKPIGSKHGNL